MIAPRQLALLVPLLFSAGLTNAGMDQNLSGSLDCTPINASRGVWVVELDERIPIAVIGDEDRPADYSSAHVLIRLTPEGATMTIGRSSGRYLASAPGGEVIDQGRCQPHTTA